MSEEILTLPPPPADIRIRYGEDPNQFIELRLPKAPGSHPLVINIHGGFWRAKYDLTHAGHLCAALTAKNLATANVEYRRVGNAGGGWPGTFADIRSALRYLQQNAAQYMVAPERLVIVGHSAGGQLAIALAAREPSIKCAVSLAGVLDLQSTFDLHLSHDAVVEFLGGTPSEVFDHYREADPLHLGVSGKTQQWIVQGSKDDVIPIDFGRRYVAAKKKNGEDVRLLEIEGADHFDLIDPRSAAWKQIEPLVTRAAE